MNEIVPGRLAERFRGGSSTPPNAVADSSGVRTLWLTSLVAGVVCLLVIGVLTGAAVAVDEPIPMADDLDDGSATVDGMFLSSVSPNLPPEEHPPDDTDVVVDMDADHVVTAAAANETPPNPYVSADGELLFVDDHPGYDRKVVQTDAGDVATADVELSDGSVEERPIARIEGQDSDLIVLGERGEIADTIEVNRDDGTVQTADGERPVEVEGETVVYEHYDDVNFEPEILDVSDADEGEDLVVDARITNTKWGEAERTVTLTLVGSDAGTTPVHETVELGSDDAENVTFEPTTTLGDSRASEVELRVNGNTDSQDVDIGAAGAAVFIQDTTEPMAGDVLVVNATIDRFGDYPEGDQTYPVTMYVDGEEVNSTVVELEPGDETNQTFSYVTNESDAPGVDVTVESPTDDDSVTVPVVSHEEFQDEIETEITSTSVGGLTDDLVVEGEFEYTGDMTQGQTAFEAAFVVDGEVVERTNVSLTGTEPANVTFAHEREPGDPPVSYVAIRSPGETDELGDVVAFDDSAEVSILEVTDPVTVGDTIVAEVGVENTGETPGRLNLSVGVDVPFAVEGDGEHTASIPLEPSETYTEDVSFELRDRAPPELDLEASVGDASDSVTIEVREDESYFRIDEAWVDEDDENEELTVASRIVNTGGATEPQDVELSFDDDTVHVETLVLEPDEEEVVSAVVDAPAEAGNYAYGASTENESVSNIVETGGTVEEPATDGVLSTITDVGESAIVWLVAALLVIGAAAGAYKYRDDPEAVRSHLRTVRRHVDSYVAATMGLLGKSGTVVVQNDLPKTVTVRVRVRTGEGVVFLEDFELGPNESRRFTCLPDSTEFEVGSGVDDITAHQEVFSEGTDRVGVVLEPSGITIGEY